MSSVIHVVDYGVGNIQSIVNMIKKVGGKAVVCSSPTELIGAEKIVLPGVGSFDFGMKNLTEGGWVDALNKLVIEQNVPILGICLGMQLMTKSSEEGSSLGLGWIDADVLKFTVEPGSSLKVPHMGWNIVNKATPNALLEDKNRFYFVHSYFVRCYDESNIISKTQYGLDFVSAFQNKNIYGVQFHPEKSHKFGMKLFKKYLELKC